MTSEMSEGRKPNGDLWLLFGFAFLKLLVNGAFITRYGFQRDELYFIACGQHLAWGYVDHAPLVPWIARLTQTLFGESLFALRIFSLLAGAATVFLIGLLTRELGGKRYAQALACCTAIAVPAYLRVHSILHIPTFEAPLWALCFYVLVLIVKHDRPKLWLLFGFLAGLALLNKPTTLFLGTGVAVGLVLTKNRTYLLSPWLWTGGAIAALMFAPNIVWQYRHDWATYRFVSELNKDTMQGISFLEFMLGQLLYMGPLTAPIWGLGLYYLLFSKRLQPYRILGFVCVTVFAILVMAKAKIYYLAPTYSILFAAGAVAFGSMVEHRGRWLKPLPFLLPIVNFLWLAPLGLPMLPVESAPKYITAATGGLIDPNMAFEITGDWRDQYGWEEQVAQIAKVYEGLTPEEQKDCIIWVRNYGEAGALDFYGRKYGLPKAACNLMTYYYWGLPEGRSGAVCITMGVRPESIYEEIEHVATITNERVNEWETNLPVFVCRKPKMSAEQAWREVVKLRV